MAAEMVHQFRLVAQQIGLASDIPRVVTMASIVEKETAAPEERPRVASVYYNRLARKYGARCRSERDLRGITGGHLPGKSPSRRPGGQLALQHLPFPGLPPGPIGNPGRSALQAALHPDSTDFLYFVSDGNGHHRFARSLEEHNRNVPPIVMRWACGKDRRQSHVFLLFPEPLVSRGTFAPLGGQGV
jgi:UPF0755 protein